MDTALSPGYARVTYEGTLFPHHMTIPINYDGTLIQGLEPNLVLSDLSVVDGSAAISGFITLLRPFFHTTTHFGLVEFHSVDQTTGADAFIWGFDLGMAGTASASQVPLSQVVMTFKLKNGRLYRLYMMEGVVAVNGKQFAPLSGSEANAIVDHVTGDSSPIYGRGNSYPFAVISQVSKTNDALRHQQGKD